MIKPPQKRSNTYPSRGDVITKYNRKTSLERLQAILAMLWMDNLTVEEKIKYCNGKIDVKKLYETYELYNWPIILDKLTKLKEKYNKLHFD